MGVCVFVFVCSPSQPGDVFFPVQLGVMGEINPLIRVSLMTPWYVCVFMFIVNGRGHCGGCWGYKG